MKVEWGQGRVEVIAARDEILAAFAKGRSVKSIYAELKASKRISLSYDGFYRRVRKLRDSATKRPSTPRGQSRMEVIKLRSRIRVAIASGRALKTVYSELKAEGRVSGTYKSFWENVRKFCGSPRPYGSRPQNAPPPPPQTPPGPAFVEERMEREPVFKRDESITLEEMIGSPGKHDPAR